MKATITIKLQAESRGELIDTFAASYRSFRAYMEELQEKDIIPKGDIRWIVVGGGWAPQVEQPVEQPVAEVPPAPRPRVMGMEARQEWKMRLQSIKVGQVWLAADGGHYGYIITGLGEDGDITARSFNNKGVEEKDRDIDSFKLSYRYFLVTECCRWLEERRVHQK